MATTLHGKATVNGVNGSVTYSAIVSAGALETMTAQVTDEADVRDRLDANGELRGMAVRNRRKSVSVTCLASVSPTSQSLTDAKKAVIFPYIPSVVTLSGFDEAGAAGGGGYSSAINGSYIYRGGGTLDYGDDWVRMTLPLVKPDHETAANLTAAVS